MSLLFDVSPEDAPRKRARKTIKIARNDPPREQNRAIYKGESAPAALGTLDEPTCLDQRCQGTAHDILIEDRVEIDGKPRQAWLIECCFCGTKQWVPVVKGHLKPQEKPFAFNDGRFAGMTVAKAFAEPRGEDYVRWAAKEHKRPAVREACQRHLDSLAASH